MPGKRILSVGQCFADHSAISRTFERHFAAEVVGADNASEAVARLRQEHFDLVLVNRVLDADGSAGLDLVKQIKAQEALRDVPVMLVSNYEDSQRQAVGLGALPGFGKAALGQPAMVARLQAVLADASPDNG